MSDFINSGLYFFLAILLVWAVGIGLIKSSQTVMMCDWLTTFGHLLRFFSPAWSLTSKVMYKINSRTEN